LSLMGKQFNKLPSEIMEIEPKTQAIAFDIACTMVLQQWEDERRAAMFGAGDGDADELAALIAHKLKGG